MNIEHRHIKQLRNACSNVQRAMREITDLLDGLDTDTNVGMSGPRGPISPARDAQRPFSGEFFPSTGYMKPSRMNTRRRGRR